MKFQYFKEILRIQEEVFKEEMPNIEKATETFVDAIENKHSIYVFGASHAGIITQEMYYRAGGCMVINPIFGREVMLDTEPVTHTSRMERLEGYGRLLAQNVGFKPGDVLVAHSVSGRNNVTVEMALEAKKAGATVIALTNLKYSKSVTSRDASGLNLYQCADIVIDNHGEKGDACVKIEGLEQKVSPSSTVIGAMIMDAIVAETIQRLVDRGMKFPPVFYSANVDGGDEKNKEVYEEYKDCIHYRF